MEIISVSIDQDTLEKFNRIKQELGFKSRSKLLRAAMNSLLNEHQSLESLTGHCDAVFTVTYQRHEKNELGKLMKKFEEIIRTEIHQHHAGTCLRVLIVCGKAEKIRKLFAVLKKEKSVSSVNYSVL